MPSVWMLSKQSMKGMDILNITTDLLYTLEQMRSGQTVDAVELKERLVRGEDLLGRLYTNVGAQVTKRGARDPFMLRIVEQVEKELGLRPSELAKVIESSQKDLESKASKEETTKLLEAVSGAVAKFTIRSVEGLSTSLL
jgi:hypothetical protein